MRIQPVAAQEVAAALVDVALGQPRGGVSELAGPEQLELVELARIVNERRNLGRRVVGLRVPGPGGRAMRTGALKPKAGVPQGSVTFDQWL